MKDTDMRYRDLQSRKLISFSAPKCRSYTGWAEYYFKRSLDGPSPDQAEHLMWWYLLLHEAKL